MAFHLNKANLELAVVRTAFGRYTFGTKSIICKITNGKLMIRVGGGYMSADGFITHYGPAEILKMKNKEEEKSQQSEEKVINDLLSNTLKHSFVQSPFLTPERRVRKSTTSASTYSESGSKSNTSSSLELRKSATATKQSKRNLFL